MVRIILTLPLPLECVPVLVSSAMSVASPMCNAYCKICRVRRSGSSYVARDLKGNKYYMNVCSKVGNIPSECSQFASENAAVFKVHLLAIVGRARSRCPPPRG